MNRSHLLFLLGASLVGNVSLGYLVLRSSPPRSPNASVAAAAAAAQSRPATGSTPSSVTELANKLAEPRTAANLREIAAQLRAAGFTDSVVNMVARVLANEELGRRKRGVYDWLNAPYWKEQRPTPAQLKAMNEVQNEWRAMMAELRLPLTPEDVAARRRHYGDLSEAKIAALDKIRQDYNELRQELSAAPRNSQADARDFAARRKLLEEEQERDIAALLTPEEKLELDLRTSNAASQVRGLLRDIDVNEQEFRSLYAAQKVYEAANPRDATRARAPAQGEAALAAWDTYQAAVRGALGEERYRQFLIGSQLENSAAKNFFTERPGVTTDQIQALARLSRTTAVEIGKELGAPGLSDDERRARVAALTTQMREETTRILGPQYAAEAEKARALPGLSMGGGAVIRTPGSGG